MNRKSLGCVINICRVHHCSLCLKFTEEGASAFVCIKCMCVHLVFVHFLFCKEKTAILWCQSPFSSRDPCSTKCLQVSGLKKVLAKLRTSRKPPVSKRGIWWQIARVWCGFVNHLTLLWRKQTVWTTALNEIWPSHEWLWSVYVCMMFACWRQCGSVVRTKLI